MQKQRTKRIIGMTSMQITVLAILSCCSFTTIGALAWMILSNSQQLTSSQPIPPTSLPANSVPTEKPTLIPTTVKAKSVQSTLEEYGYTVASSDSEGAMYIDSCGSQATWAKNKPDSVNFFIPLGYDFCDQTGVVAPIVFSVKKLYPASVGDWLTETLQNDEKTTRIILGENVTDIIDGYMLILYFIQDENTLLFSINAPGEF